MGAQHRPPKRLWAALIIVIIAAGLVAWEFFGPESRVDGGLREAAIILTADEPYPPVLFVEKNMDYRLAVTAATGRHSLADWTGRVSAEKVEVEPGAVLHVDVSATEWRDGQPIGPGGPIVRVVDSLDLLAATGEVYSLSVIAADDGLIPRQVRLTEGIKASIHGISSDAVRMLLIEGARLYLPVSPDNVTELRFDAPTPGVYNVLCEQGCEDRGWQGALRIETLESEVPWVEARDTDAVAELGRRAPDFTLYDDGGRVVQLSDFQHDKPVFINFWATWCPPCKREMPAMQELYDRRGNEFELLAVNYLENRSQVDAFMDELQLDFPVLMDVAGAVNSRYGVWSYPTSVFVDRDGFVRGRFLGELSPELMEEFIDIITE